ncbi:hypothetical protein WJG03_002511 [Klebsiella aerogenes]
MLVNMMVKNHAIISMPLITGETDEVRVQSEEPNSVLHEVTLREVIKKPDDANVSSGFFVLLVRWGQPKVLRQTT